MGLFTKADDAFLSEICGKKSENKETWSLLPALLLWMIKDRLDFVSNVRLAAVCRNWWSASSSYPKKLQSGLPWIMQRSSNDKGTREFICVSSMEKFTIRLPEIYGEALTLSSKKGWLLVRHRNLDEHWLPNSRPFSVFLFKPFAKAKIELPDLKDSMTQVAGSFCTDCEGKPSCVALIVPVKNRGLTLRVAYPGDNRWTDHHPFPNGVQFNFSSLAIKGTQVYALEFSGRMFVYDMQSQVTKVLPSSNPNYQCYMVELEGEIVKIEHSRNRIDARSSLQIFRCNATEGVWEKLNLNDEDIKDTSLFLRHGCYCLSAKEKGVKIYSLEREREFSRSDDRVFPKSVPRLQFRVCDLVDEGISEMLFSYQLNLSARWVDMG